MFCNNNGNCNNILWLILILIVFSGWGGNCCGCNNNSCGCNDGCGC